MAKKSASAGHVDGAMMSGKAGVSPRKAMAGVGMHDAEMAGSTFGVESFDRAQRHGGAHPDAMAGTGSKHLEDHERGIGHSIHHTKDHHPAQAAPHHGPHHPGGYQFGHQHEDHPRHAHETHTHEERMHDGQHEKR